MPKKTKGNKCEGLRVGHLNVCHLRNKVADLSVFVNEPTPYHVFGISESHLDSTVTDELLSIPSYSIIRRDADSNDPLHHGIAVYIHQSIQSVTRRRPDLESEEIEGVWLEVNPSAGAKSLFVCYLYRNGKSLITWYDAFIRMMDKVSSISSNIILLGDFNLDLFNNHPGWNYTANLFGLEQIIETYTRYDSVHDSYTLIDHIYVTNTETVISTDVPIVDFSDHNAVVCTLSHKVPKAKRNQHSYITYRSFKDFNEDAFLSDLSRAPFNDIYQLTDPQEAMSLWFRLLLGVLNHHAPVKRKRVRQAHLPPWFNDDIQKAMALRKELRKDKSKKKEFKKQKNVVKHLVRKAKREHFQKLVKNDGSVRSVWKAVRSITQGNQSPSIPSTLSASDLNSHFLSVSDIIDEPDSAYSCSESLRKFCADKNPSNQPLSIPPITVLDVGEYIAEIGDKKSAGTDGINGYILKLSLPHTLETLTYVYNLCIEKDVFPDELKLAKVIPLPKSKELNDPNNYRPISLLSIISKPLEKHIHAHLLDYLDKFELLHTLQSGYRPKHSCHTALSHMTNKWLANIDEDKMTGAVFLDLRKAFDLINHNILIDKLNLYLKCEKTVSFLRSYLDNRQQCVYAHGEFSTNGYLKSGVPQGSVLGPLLFCIFINDLPLNLSDPTVDCELFADDTTLHTARKEKQEIENALQSSLDEVSSWCSSNCMLIHPQKTKSMLVSTRQKLQNSTYSLSLSIDSTSVEQVFEHKVLGVTLDDQFKWEAHTHNLCNKLSQNLFLLSKLKHFVDQDTRKLFFNAHIKPYIDYSSTIWDMCPQTHMQHVNSLYRRAAKLILPDPSLSTDGKMKKLKIPPLDKQFEYNKGIFMYKIINFLAPSYLYKFLELSQTRYENSRSGFKPAKTRIDLTEAKIGFAGITLWNSFPNYVRERPTIASFKKSLRQYLLNND